MIWVCVLYDAKFTCSEMSESSKNKIGTFLLPFELHCSEGKGAYTWYQVLRSGTGHEEKTNEYHNAWHGLRAVLARLEYPIHPCWHQDSPNQS